MQTPNFIPSKQFQSDLGRQLSGLVRIEPYRSYIVDRELEDTPSTRDSMEAKVSFWSVLNNSDNRANILAFQDILFVDQSFDTAYSTDIFVQLSSSDLKEGPIDDVIDNGDPIIPLSSKISTEKEIAFQHVVLTYNLYIGTKVVYDIPMGFIKFDNPHTIRLKGNTYLDEETSLSFHLVINHVNGTISVNVNGCQEELCRTLRGIGRVVDKFTQYTSQEAIDIKSIKAMLTENLNTKHTNVPYIKDGKLYINGLYQDINLGGGKNGSTFDPNPFLNNLHQQNEDLIKRVENYKGEIEKLIESMTTQFNELKTLVETYDRRITALENSQYATISVPLDGGFELWRIKLTKENAFAVPTSPDKSNPEHVLLTTIYGKTTVSVTYDSEQGTIQIS